MKKMSATIVFFGNERLATGVSTTTPTIKRLLASGYNVAAIVSNYERPNSRKPRQLEIEEVAQAYSIPLLLPTKLSAISEQLIAYQPTIGVLVAYGRIIPQPIIDIFPKGIVNIHPSLLPLHRGPTPIESVILKGEPVTGVSLMQLAQDMDAGPVFAQVKHQIGSQSKQQLADELLDLGSKLLLDNLPFILSDELKPWPQDNSSATYDSLIKKGGGIIDWSHSAAEIERQVRAYAGWPRSRTQIGNNDVVITAAHVTDGAGEPGSVFNNTRQLGIYCNRGLLIIDKLIVAGKPEMSAQAFLAGYKLD